MRSNLQRTPESLPILHHYTLNPGQQMRIMTKARQFGGNSIGDRGAGGGGRECGRTLHQRSQSSLMPGDFHRSGGSARTHLGRSNPSHRYIKVEPFTVHRSVNIGGKARRLITGVGVWDDRCDVPARKVARVKRGIEKDDTHKVSVGTSSDLPGRKSTPIELHKPFLQPLKLTRIDCPRKTSNIA